MPRNRIAGLYGKLMFNFLRNCQTVFQRGGNILHSSQQSSRVPGVVNILFCRDALCVLSHVWLFVTPWTVACQTPLSMGFSRQEYRSGMPFLIPVDLPDRGWNIHLLHLPHCQAGSSPLGHLESPHTTLDLSQKLCRDIWGHFMTTVLKVGNLSLKELNWLAGRHPALVKPVLSHIWPHIPVILPCVTRLCAGCLLSPERWGKCCGSFALNSLCGTTGDIRWVMGPWAREGVSFSHLVLRTKPRKWFTWLTYFFQFAMKLRSCLTDETVNEPAGSPSPVDFGSLVIAWLATELGEEILCFPIVSESASS